MKVFKYVLEIADTVLVDMPEGAEIIHIAEQYGELCLWAKVNPQRKLTQRTFFIRGTGHPVEADWGYYGTAHVGSFVWHVFGPVEGPWK